MRFIDLHCHTFYSDGVLSPAELVYRCKLKGAEAVALTDHADYSNMDFIIGSIRKAVSLLEKFYDLKVIAGIELTYIPPEDIARMTAAARESGAELVVVHGETTAEQVPPGTNISAINAKCDILAHPGHLTSHEAQTAKNNGVFIELTTRRGHKDTNKEVYEVASKAGADLVMNTDCHEPEDLMDELKSTKVLNHCGVEPGFAEVLRNNALKLISRIRKSEND